MSSAYEGMGEFHDLFMPEVWERLRGDLTAVFGALGSADVVVDVGAGSGVGTRVLASCTDSQLIAVEPSLTMRAVLLSRIIDDPELTPRISVVAGSAPEALDDIEGPIAGFVCAHMLGHLTAAQREAMFARLAQLITADGTGFVTLPPVADTDQDGADDADGEGEEETVLQEERSIGQHRYVARYLSSPDGGRSEYLVLRGDQVLRRASFPSSWNPPTVDELRAEFARGGLSLEEASDRVAVIRRKPASS